MRQSRRAIEKGGGHLQPSNQLNKAKTAKTVLGLLLRVPSIVALLDLASQWFDKTAANPAHTMAKLAAAALEILSSD